MPPKKQPDVTAFDEFMKNAGFTEKTISILKENGFESADELGLLVGRTDDIDGFGLTLAQKLKLSRYVTDVAPGRGEGAPRSADLISVLRELKDSQEEVAQERTNGAVRTPANPETSELAVADPLIYLRDASGTSSFRDIVDYVHLVSPVQEEQVVGEDDRVQIVFRSATRKPKLQDITVEEWALANVRIMDEMYVKAELSGSAVRDYMAYTAKICELFRRYDRVTVLQYDREYRFLQARHRFRWGLDAPHLHTVHLRPKSVGDETFDASTGSSRNRRKPPTQGGSSQVCRLYNYSKDGCKYQNCKFRHVCGEPGCNRPHPSRDHHSLDGIAGRD